MQRKCLVLYTYSEPRKKFLEMRHALWTTMPRTVYEQLRDKHKSLYDEERLRMWAHLIQMGKHASLDEPPDKPLFRR